ncbi:sodium-dependent transporter [Desulfobaculum senezii]|jgi:NSS family neurotransmitter:Na+ symporter|uniref:sodium-dependent transporter n=1 Tax=Desulfobaculum sp. SPO524 TaxID=3378071 RepID=UPI0038555482
MTEREQWGSRIGFILAAVGSAIGLGNIWRFPYMAYENGGGAFLIPYIFAMLTAGIPFMILEFGLGHKFRGSAPKTFAAINPKWEWLGWMQVLVAAVIAVYYVAIIGWSIAYTGFAVTQAWGTAPKDFFFGEFLALTGSPFELGSLRPIILVATIVAWGVTWAACISGVKAGIERAVKVLMPTLFILLMVMIFRVVTLPGANEGLNWLFKPDFSALSNYKVWVAAYGQIFFTLSIGFAIMIAYSSYLPKKSDINNNACMTVFINCGFSMAAGVMIFAVLGYMAAKQGVGVNEVVSGGVGLAFITIPTAINLMPMPAVFGTLFFLALTMAGISSHISIVEACISAFMDKMEWTRRKTVNIICGTGFVVSLVFCSGAGLLILDIVDHFINNFGIMGGAVVEIFLITWLCNLDVVRDHVNRNSEFYVGTVWSVCLRFVTVPMLGFLFVTNLVGDLKALYGGYSLISIVSFGWLVFAATVVIGIAMQAKTSPAGYIGYTDNSLKR